MAAGKSRKCKQTGFGSDVRLSLHAHQDPASLDLHRVAAQRIGDRLAQHLAEPFDLKYLPYPVALPEIAINVFWHAKMHRSPDNQWLRRTVFELFADSTTGQREVRS